MVKFLKHSVKPLDASKIAAVEGKFNLRVVQQPVKARVAGRKQTRNSSRRLVDPQPVVEIRLNTNPSADDNVVDHSLSMFFVRASIECLGSQDKESFFQKQRKSRFFEKTENDDEVLRGTTTVSAQFYRGSPYTACAVFDNLSVRYKGNYRLKFDLFEIQSFSSGGTIIPRIIHWTKSTNFSSLFTVYTDAAFDGLEASPELNNELKKAGCKIRARKQRNTLGGMADIDGFRISKKLQYNNGQMRYSMGTNHFGIDEAVFNRPGTSLDLQMLQNFQNAQAAAAAAAANISGNVIGNNTPFQNFTNVSNGFNPVKRPQTALPQLITNADQFNNYSDMLRSAITPSEYSNSPIEQPQPRRNFHVQSAGPFSSYSEMLSMTNNNDIDSPTGQRSLNNSSITTPSLSTPSLSTPSMTTPSMNNSLNMPSSTSATPVAMANNQASFNSYTVGNSMMSMMMPNGSPSNIDQLLQQQMGDSIGTNVPRNSVPVENIPMYWDNLEEPGVQEINQDANQQQQNDNMDLNNELLNLNAMYQQSDMLLRQNFQM